MGVPKSRMQQPWDSGRCRRPRQGWERLGFRIAVVPQPRLAVCSVTCPAQVPSALLSLAWDAAVMADVEAAAEEQRSPLRPELLARAQTLS